MQNGGVFPQFFYEYRTFFIHSKIHSIVRQKYSFKEFIHSIVRQKYSFKEFIHSKNYLIIHSMKILFFLKKCRIGHPYPPPFPQLQPQLEEFGFWRIMLLLQCTVLQPFVVPFSIFVLLLLLLLLLAGCMPLHCFATRCILLQCCVVVCIPLHFLCYWMYRVSHCNAH